MGWIKINIYIGYKMYALNEEAQRWAYKLPRLECYIILTYAPSESTLECAPAIKGDSMNSMRWRKNIGLGKTMWVYFVQVPTYYLFMYEDVKYIWLFFLFSQITILTIVERPELTRRAPQVLIPPVDEQTVLQRMCGVPPPAAGPHAEPRHSRPGPAPADSPGVVGLTGQLSPKLGLKTDMSCT